MKFLIVPFASAACAVNPTVTLSQAAPVEMSTSGYAPGEPVQLDVTAVGAGRCLQLSEHAAATLDGVPLQLHGNGGPESLIGGCLAAWFTSGDGGFPPTA